MMTTGMNESRVWVLDGRGGGQRLEGLATVEQIPKRQKGQSETWIHCNAADPEARAWLVLQTQNFPLAKEILLDDFSQTRVELSRDQQLLVALAAGAGEQSGSHILRLWASPRRLVSVSHEPLPVVRDLEASLEAGRGPRRSADILFISSHAAYIRGRDAAARFEEELAAVEYDAVLSPRETFDRLRVLHQAASGLRRGKLREQDAAARIVVQSPAWLVGSDGESWSDVAKRSDDLISRLDGVIDRTGSLHEWVQGDLAAVLNDRLYILTLISVITLPLSFITGLLGVNIGGLPFRDSSWAFAALCLLLIGVALMQIIIARRLRWIPRHLRPLGTSDPSASSASAETPGNITTKPRREEPCASSSSMGTSSFARD
jgi:zinc transporter